MHVLLIPHYNLKGLMGVVKAGLCTNKFVLYYVICKGTIIKHKSHQNVLCLSVCLTITAA